MPNLPVPLRVAMGLLLLAPALVPLVTALSPVSGENLTPEHVHLTAVVDPDGNPLGLKVHWTTAKPYLQGEPVVQYRKGPLGPIERPATFVDLTRDLSDSKQQHRALYTAVLPDVTPGQAIRYRVGHPVGGFTLWLTGQLVPGADAPVRLLALGDLDRQGVTHEGVPYVGPDGLAWDAPAYHVIQEGLAHEPDAVLIAGDLAYANDDMNDPTLPDEVREENGVQAWGKWFNMTEPLFAKVPVMPAAGNHEYRGNGVEYNYYRSWWDLPEDELYYGFRAGSIYVVNLASHRFCEAGFPDLSDVCEIDGTGPNLLILDRLETELAQAAASGAPWIVTVFHHPPYSRGPHHSDLAIRADWVPLLEQHGVDVVLNGHNHNYQRTHPLLGHTATQTNTTDYEEGEGIVYVTTGNGGRKLGPIHREEPWGATGRRDHGYGLFEATEDALRFEAYFLGEDTPWDAFTVSK